MVGTRKRRCKMANANRTVTLWLDNDEGLYHERRRIVAEAYETSQSRADVADALEEFVKGLIDFDNLSGMASDLMQDALGSVDWFDMADDYIEEGWENEDIPKEDEDAA